MPSDITSAIAIGFLTVVQHPQHGHFGGYLLLNATGRPMEFHCTAPIMPSRAQQILYGPTLEPFLYGEQIGATLVAKSSQSATVVLVDQPAGIFVRQHIESPAALVANNDAAERPVWMAEWIELPIGRNRLMLPTRHAADRELIARRLAAIDELFDLREPFDRIREAIEEAQAHDIGESGVMLATPISVNPHGRKIQSDAASDIVAAFRGDIADAASCLSTA